METDRQYLRRQFEGVPGRKGPFTKEIHRVQLLRRQGRSAEALNLEAALNRIAMAFEGKPVDTRPGSTAWK